MFRLNRNERSHWSGNGVHVDPESVFMISRNMHKPGVKDKIVDMAFNGSGVRDTARVLKIGINTVIRALKNSPQGK